MCAHVAEESTLNGKPLGYSDVFEKGIFLILEINSPRVFDTNSLHMLIA